MKFDYCAMHSGAVVGSLELSCLVIRHDDGTAARQSEVWAEIERMRSVLRECRLALIFAPAHDPALMARILDALGDST